ncbi:DUF3189 family protein [Natranaerobius thermophilus]|uniref:DUF3189 family protein n=1 Tax=Natranaerobius thermophilus (strain ATCC BAA-1301 / DSM 18059 / JW/NM-WN-LF) TaxID=457570 RepID=B2A4N1_NATTJ|nr:DUF3189 family protein [Natranaerobius thermophilus]ACB85206.1 conserved hypothetical protein [Natranaerobius thermophilus JW/NM-WN-LF]
MKIVYHCFGGTHSSVIAAAIHVGLLPQGSIPDIDELDSIRIFDSPKNIIPGRLHFFGEDEQQNEIYSCGMKNNSHVVKNAIIDVMEKYGLDSGELKFVNTLPCVNLMMRIGGYTSQRLNLTSIGRPLVIRGSLKAYQDIEKTVHNTRQELLGNTQEEVQ